MELCTKLPICIVRHIYGFMYYNKKQYYNNFIKFYCNNRYVLKQIKYLHEIYSDGIVISLQNYSVIPMSEKMKFYEYVLSNQSLIDIVVP